MIEEPGQEESLRDLVARVIDNTKAYVRAEVTLVKQTASLWVSRIKPAAIFIVAAILLVQAALTILVAALGMTLALWIGPAGGLAIAGLVALAMAGLLGWMAVSRLTGPKP